VQKHPLTTTPPITVVGIDVGGVRKGFHAVALRDGVYAGQLATVDVQELAHWCRSVVGASVIAIDAPCRWSSDGRARPCERELMRQGIFCFATFPHAITWHLRNGEAKARQKRPQRTALLAQACISTAPLTSIDLIDAGERCPRSPSGCQRCCLPCLWRAGHRPDRGARTPWCHGRDGPGSAKLIRMTASARPSSYHYVVGKQLLHIIPAELIP
jgi:hypothetical protein